MQKSRYLHFALIIRCVWSFLCTTARKFSINFYLWTSWWYARQGAIVNFSSKVATDVLLLYAQILIIVRLSSVYVNCALIFLICTITRSIKLDPLPLFFLHIEQRWRKIITWHLLRKHKPLCVVESVTYAGWSMKCSHSCCR